MRTTKVYISKLQQCFGGLILPHQQQQKTLFLKFCQPNISGQENAGTSVSGHLLS